MSASRLGIVRPKAGRQQLLSLVHQASLGLPSTSKAGALWASRRWSHSHVGTSVKRVNPIRQEYSQIGTRQHRSYAASALAVAETDQHDEYAYQQSISNDRHHQPESHSSVVSEKPPSPARRPSKRTTIPPIWSRLPHDIELLLDRPSTSASDFRAAFDTAQCQPYHLARLTTMEGVWNIWRETAEASHWAWLGGQLGHVLEMANAEELESGLVPMIQAIRARALARLGQREEARNILHTIKQDHATVYATAHLVQARTWSDLGEQTELHSSLSSFFRSSLASTFTLTDGHLDILEVLIREAHTSGGQDALIELVLAGGGRLRTLLLTYPGGPTSTPHRLRMARILLQALSTVSDPVAWLQNHLEGGGKDTRWMGATLLKALTTRKSAEVLHRMKDLHQFLIREDLPLPPAVALRGLVRSAAAGDSQFRSQATARISRDLSSLAQPVLSTLLRHASRTSNVSETRRLWAALIDRFEPTMQDRVNFLRHALDTSSPEAIKAQFRQYFRTDDYAPAQNMLLSLHVRNNDIASARAVYDSLSAQPSIENVNKMLGAYAANAMVESAVEIFDDAVNMGVQPNIASYTSLVSVFANRHDVENARNVFGLMEDAGIEADAPAYSAVLNAEVEAGEWDKAVERWNTIPPHIKTASTVISVLLKAYVLLAMPTQRVMQIFRSTDRPSAYIWSLAMQSAADNGDMILAQDLLNEMQAAAAESGGARPSVFHYSILLHGYMRLGSREQAREVYEGMIERAIIPTSITYGMIMQAFRGVDGSHGFDQAMQFAASINLSARQLSGAPRARGTGPENLYGPLISMSGKSGEIKMAEQYLELAAPDRSSVPLYTRLMDAYRHAGRTDSVLAIWEKAFTLACDSTRKTASSVIDTVAVRRTRDNILCIPLSIVLDSLASAGRYLDLRRVWDSVQTAGFGFDAQNYNHYATALARTGDVERAFSIVENILIPRYEEVKQRVNFAVRQHPLQPLAPPPEEPIVEDNATVPAFRPPNRRHELRYGSPTQSTASSDVHLLRNWRPADLLWKPSFLTLSVLEHSFSQLQDSDRRALLALGSSEEDMDPEVDSEDHLSSKVPQDIVTLPSFGNVPVRGTDGQPKRTTPRAILLRLNRKYAKTLALVIFHRRKRKGARRRDDQ